MRNAPGQCRGKRDGSTYLQRFLKRVKIDLLVNVYKPQNRQLCIIVVVSKSCHCMVPRFMLFFLCFLPRYCWFLPLLFNLFCYIRTLFLMHLFFLATLVVSSTFFGCTLGLASKLLLAGSERKLLGGFKEVGKQGSKTTSWHDEKCHIGSSKCVVDFLRICSKKIGFAAVLGW